MLVGGGSLHNPDVLQAWVDAPSHLHPTLAAAAAAHADGRQHEGGSPRQRASWYSPAEVSQHSVDLLLHEYYQMATLQAAGMRRKPQAGLVQRAFLVLLCPCCHLEALGAAVSAALVWLSVVLVPAWLALVRHHWQQQDPYAVAGALLGGLLVLVAADATHRWSRRPLPQQACTNGRTTGGADVSLATLRAAAGGSAHNSSGSRPHAREPSAATGGGRLTFAALQPDLAALLASVGVSSTSRSASDPSPAALLSDLSVLCDAVGGVSVSAEAVATPEAAAATIARLKQHVGV